LKQFLSGEVFRGISLHLLLEHGDFVCIDISQGSAVTRIRRGGIYKYAFIANLMISLSERILKIGKTFAEVTNKTMASCFSDSQCTVCPQKVSPLTFCNNNRKSAPI